MKFVIDDTIAAIATPVGESGIGIVRISGNKALLIADSVFRSKNGEKPSQSKGYTLHYGWINGLARSSNSNSANNVSLHRQDIIDEVLLTVMRAPRTYTREDVVEINCHGGIVALKLVLDKVLENGCRLAQPGEFTRRAFLNGRIDLSQAEAVLEIIKAKTDAALDLGIRQLEGGLSKSINKVRGDLLDILSFLEADIDFPDESLENVNIRKVLKELNEVSAVLKSLLEGSKHGRIYSEGITAVICGKPNAGKSSLLNALLKKDRAIVTPVAGTTRDTIEEIIDIKGIPVRMVDTAGIVKPAGLVEKKAVQRTHKQIDSADLLIMVFDGSSHLSKEDSRLMRKLLPKKKAVIAVINKIDLKQKIEEKKILKEFGGAIKLSAKKARFINLLEDKIQEIVYGGKVRSPDSVLVANMRHIQSIRKALGAVNSSLGSFQNNLSLEFASHDIKAALDALDEMLGKRFSEDLLDKIFSEFCIGK